MIARFLVAVALVMATALAAAWATHSPAQATNFNPFFGPPDFYRLDPTTPGVNPDVHAQFNILPPSTNFSRHVGGSITFEDSDVFIASSADIPGTGAYVGRVESVAHLGLANEGCNTQTAVTFDLVEANVSTTARPFTNGGAMTVGAGGIATAVDDAVTTFTYSHSLDPLGLRQGTDGTPVEGTIPAGVNEIRVDGEEMLVVGVDPAANTYQVVRGWNNSAPAAHSAGAAVTRVAVMYPNGPGTNLLANLGEDDGDLDNNGVAEEAPGPGGGPQFNGNQVADGAGAVPSFVRDSLIPSANPDDGVAIQARARYIGVAFVANTLVVILQFVIMDPGTLPMFPNLDWAMTAWGYSSLTFLQDPLGPPSNSGISDFCGFSSKTLLYGTTHDNDCTAADPPVGCSSVSAGFILKFAADGGCPGFTTPNECGATRSTNPATAQRLRFYQYMVSQRDYDNDGHENPLDPCAFHPNPNWNPRDFNTAGGDADADGLPDECDPNDAFPNSDEDGDGWGNRQDNCPTVANPSQSDNDVPPGQDVPDGGPRNDDIGDACDVAVNSCPGCPALTSTGANGRYHATYAAQTICIGPATSDCSLTLDGDGDGVVNATDTCRDGFNLPIPFAGTSGTDSLAVAAAAGSNTIAVGSAAGFTVGSPIVIGSGGTRETLRYITNIAGNAIEFADFGGPPALDQSLVRSHAAGEPVAQVAFAQSLRDLQNNGFTDTADMAFISLAFGAGGGNPGNDGVDDDGTPGYEGRKDLNYSGFLDTGDMAHLTDHFGRQCGPP